MNRIKAAERRQKEALLEPEEALERGRSPRETKERANGVKAVVVHNEILPWCDGVGENP